MHQPRFARDLQLQPRSFNLDLSVFNQYVKGSGVARLNSFAYYFRHMTLVLQPNKELFSDNFKAILVSANDTREEVDILDRQYYKGHVAGQENSSSVHFRVKDDGSCHGSIFTSEEK